MHFFFFTTTVSPLPKPQNTFILSAFPYALIPH